MSRWSPEFTSWHAMVQRCTNTRHRAYSYYGGRGITVCERWRRFADFLADMGKRPPGTSLDRIDNSRGYEPGNCRWTSHHEQLQNTRRTRLSREIVIDIRERIARGERQSDIARSLGLRRSDVSRINTRRRWANVA